jgi:hypothetical protein
MLEMSYKIYWGSAPYARGEMSYNLNETPPLMLEMSHTMTGAAPPMHELS